MLYSLSYQHQRECGGRRGGGHHCLPRDTALPSMHTAMHPGLRHGNMCDVTDIADWVCHTLPWRSCRRTSTQSIDRSQVSHKYLQPVRVAQLRHELDFEQLHAHTPGTRQPAPDPVAYTAHAAHRQRIGRAADRVLGLEHHIQPGVWSVVDNEG